MNSEQFNNLIRTSQALDTINDNVKLTKDEKTTIDLLKIDTIEQIKQATEQQHTITN